MYQQPHSLVGALILSARRPFSLPFFTYEDYQSHIDGSPNGKFAIRASYSEELFLPSKGRDFYVKSSEHLRSDDALTLASQFVLPNEEEMEDSLRTKADRISRQVDHPALVTIEQRRPYGLSVVVSRSVETYFLGIHSESVDFLLWSNCEGLEHELQVHRPEENFLTYRFSARKDFGVVLHSKRLASRWYRYQQAPTMREPSRRFQAFERSLFATSND